MTDGIGIQGSQVIIGASTYMIDYVRKIMNDFFGTAELSDDTIALFVTEMQSLYEIQTNNIGMDWETQPQAILGCIARWAALYAATALNSAGLGGGNMSYTLGALQVDRKDTIDNINFFKIMAESCAKIHGFHPSQGIMKVELTTSQISGTHDVITEW